MNILAIINSAIDWFSVKITGLCIPFMFIAPEGLVRNLGAIAFISTIAYNGVRIGIALYQFFQNYKQVKK
jgi:hypothetical protein